eukprot:2691273-Rhodomonas_salina.3
MTWCGVSLPRRAGLRAASGFGFRLIRGSRGKMLASRCTSVARTTTANFGRGTASDVVDPDTTLFVSTTIESGTIVPLLVAAIPSSTTDCRDGTVQKPVRVSHLYKEKKHNPYCTLLLGSSTFVPVGFNLSSFRNGTLLQYISTPRVTGINTQLLKSVPTKDIYSSGTSTR